MPKPQAFSKNNKSHNFFKLTLLAVSVNCAFVQADDEYSKEKYMELGKILLKDNYWVGLNTDNKGVNTPFGLDPVYTPKSYVPNKKGDYVWYHAGIDYQASNNTKVYSPVDGTVVELPSKSNVGMLAIQMSDAKCVSLLHLNSSIVEKGKVNRGQLIAYSGSTGTEKPHLHIELRNGSCQKQPFPWIYSAESLAKANALNPLTLLQNSCPIPVEPPVASDNALTSLYNIPPSSHQPRIVSVADNAAHLDSRLELVSMLVRLLEFKKQKTLSLGDTNQPLENKLADVANLLGDNKDDLEAKKNVLRKAIEMNLIDSSVSFRPNCRITQNEAYILFERAYNWYYAGNARPSNKYSLPTEFNVLKDNTTEITRATTAKYLLALLKDNSSSSWDTSPNSFTFSPLTNIELSKVLTSNTVTVSGINKAVQASIQNGKFSVGCQFNFDSMADSITKCDTFVSS